MDPAALSTAARGLRDALEPTIGQVYFSPEAHQEYVGLGFSPSPGDAGGVALPDGSAYFCSRGSILGQVPGPVIAAAFAVFNPDAVTPAVSAGWRLTDAETIFAARQRGATAQLVRILGEPAGLERVTSVLLRGVDAAHVAARPLFAGLLARGLPDDPMGRLFRAGDLLRELRGDAHNDAWVSAGLTPVEIGLLTERWWGLPFRSYVRTRAWSDAQLDEALESLSRRGLVSGDDMTEAGFALREELETVTDRQMAPVIEAIGDDLDAVVETLRGWSRAVVDGNGYLKGARDIA